MKIRLAQEAKELGVNFGQPYNDFKKFNMNLRGQLKQDTVSFGSNETTQAYVNKYQSKDIDGRSQAIEKAMNEEKHDLLDILVDVEQNHFLRQEAKLYSFLVKKKQNIIQSNVDSDFLLRLYERQLSDSEIVGTQNQLEIIAYQDKLPIDIRRKAIITIKASMPGQEYGAGRRLAIMYRKINDDRLKPDILVQVARIDLGTTREFIARTFLGENNTDLENKCLDLMDDKDKLFKYVKAIETIEDKEIQRNIARKIRKLVKESAENRPVLKELAENIMRNSYDKQKVSKMDRIVNEYMFNPKKNKQKALKKKIIYMLKMSDVENTEYLRSIAQSKDIKLVQRAKAVELLEEANRFDVLQKIAQNSKEDDKFVNDYVKPILKNYQESMDALGNII